MNLDLDGRIAVVTGASSGIGREIAKVLAGEGARVIVVSRRTALLESLQAEVVKSGGKRPVAISADLYDRAMPARIRDQVLQQFGRADILVNSAGGSRQLPTDASDEAWDESFAINFTAVRKMTHALLPTMQQQKWGRILNITGSMEPRMLNAANAAKAGVHAWAKGLSRVIGKDGVTVNSLQPGRIHSEQIDQRLHPTREDQEQFAQANIPLGFFGDPEDMAYLAAFLCSPKARYITGQRIYVDGGLHHAI
ncbi:MAG TPA: SDR family oxidoreductase [Burkholderiales bacterium]|nr:SDR family oxidoreductase [Burkholderiales bacterium]